MFDSGISIVGNSIKYGFESIHCEWDANLKIDNNICDSSTSCALTLWYIVGTEITGNLISNRYNLDGYAGVFILACSGKIDINNNQILLYNGGDGLEFWQTSSSNYLCANNFIYLAGELPTFGTGIQSFNGSGLHLLYNTVICVNHLGMACEIYQDNKNVIENNIFYNDANYPTCEFYKAINLTSNYNDFFSSSSKLVMWNLKTYNTLSKFQSVSKTDKNSISVNPFFASKEDPPACK